MATTTISPREYRQVTLDYLAASEEEFQRGDALQGAQKLWGATAHSIMSVAKERDWPHQSHRALKNAAARIAPSSTTSFAECWLSIVCGSRLA